MKCRIKKIKKEKHDKVSDSYYVKFLFFNEVLSKIDLKKTKMKVGRHIIVIGLQQLLPHMNGGNVFLRISNSNVAMAKYWEVVLINIER